MSALLLDTSTRHLIAARLSGNESRFLCLETALYGEDALDQAVATLFPDLDAIGEIYLGEGPGSFVGLRSSFAYVRMLAMLRKICCRTFRSSMLWHLLLGVPPNDWLLLRTNARMFYAERFCPQSEAIALELSNATALDGAIYCYADSWRAKAPLSEMETLPQHWQIVFFDAEKIPKDKITADMLGLSAVKPHDLLTPVYGHELHFKLAKGNHG